MEWTPISEQRLLILINEGIAEMQPHARTLWEMICIPPCKWQLPPWGDEGGGFWVVGILGERIIWYNDIEEGFNISCYKVHGIIDTYLCNQDELHHTMNALLQTISTGQWPGGLGPPQPIPKLSGL